MGIKTNAIARSALPDSLMRLWTDSPHDTILFGDILKQLHILNQNAPDQVINFGRRILQQMPDELALEKQAGFYNTLGIAYYYANEYDSALQYFLKTLSIRERIGRPESISNSLNSIGNIYYGTRQYDDCLEYYEKALAIAIQSGYLRGIIATSTNLGAYYTTRKNFDVAIEYFAKAYETITQVGDSSQLAIVLNNMATLKRQLNQNQEALQFDKRALEIASNRDELWEVAYIHNSIGESYMALEQYATAYIHFKKALLMADNINALDLQLYSYRMLSTYYASMGNVNGFKKYFELYQAAQDSIFDNERRKTLADFRVRYQTQQKEKENELQKMIIARQSVLNTFLIVMSVMILLMGLLIYGRYRQKQRINAQLERKVSERTQSLQEEIAERRRLELRILSTTIETEERERKRFSEDLHDGLGPLLSTVQMYVDLISNKSGKQQQQLIEQAGVLLDEAIVSTRQIANNLTPNLLNDFGLAEALQNFAQQINASGSLHMDVNVDDNFPRVSALVEVALYRIVAELISNTLKHARATNITVRLWMDDQQLMIEYHDDGIGFDSKRVMAAPHRGLGLTNIISRLRSVNGTYQLLNQPDAGGFRVRIMAPVNPL
jgi:signal transduction histidine kinase